MKDVLGRIGSDFFSAFLFLILYVVTGSLWIATCVAVAAALGQVAYARVKGQQLSSMTWVSLALVILLGGLTLFTNDVRFMLAKPAIAHFAISAVMLKRGWMLRYVPQIVVDNASDAVILAGYLWAALIFALGAGVVAVAMTGDLKLWAYYVSVVAVGAKVVAAGIQILALRILVARRLRTARAA